MTSRLRNLAITAGIVVFVGWWVMDLFLAPQPALTHADETTHPPTVPDPASGAGSSVPGSSASPIEAASTPLTSSSMVPSSNRVSYAVYVHELQGIPPDAMPGTQLELWVAWEPPVTEGPRMQRLLTDVWVEKIVTGITPEAPVTAILSVRRSQLSDLLYADRWGSLAVAVR